MLHRGSALAAFALLAFPAGAYRLLQHGGTSRNATAEAESRLSLLPYPANVELAAGSNPFELQASAGVSVGDGISQDDPAVVTLKALLAEASGNGGAQSAVQTSSNTAEKTISLRLADKKDSTGSADGQGYRLHITDKAVEIEAPSSEGLFYGVQTLRQLASRKEGAATAELPALTITDAPRFTWRGLHLDVSRHFFTTAEVKRLLDVMSLFKLNRFHWHLTDDQGWRLPVDGYPKLTEVGGAGKAYTKEEIQEVVAYAQARHIDVIPEVDLPGHSQAALFAYPDLGNSDVQGWKAPRNVMQEWGVSQYTLAPSNDTFDFLGKVFDTLAELFPSKVVHIGGDEVMTTEWTQSAKAISFMGGEASAQDVGDKVSAAFGKKVVELLKAHDRRAAAWDEAQHTGFWPDDGVVVAWRDFNEAKQAVEAGRQVVVADQGVLYFDHAQSSSNEPRNQGGCSSWQKVYQYDPMPTGLTDVQQALVIGAQGQLWSEYLPTWEHAEYMAHPRSLALAEITWTPKAAIQDEAEFESRLRSRLGDLDHLGINYRKLGGNCY